MPAYNHYDLRAFHNDNITVPQTVLDYQYWNVGHFDGSQMIDLSSRRSVVGVAIAATTLTQLDLLKQSQLDVRKISDLESQTISSGNENWSTGSTVTVGKDSTLRYATTIRVTLTSGVTQTITSTYNDNIIQDFPNDGSTYFIELALPGFPAQGAAGYLDLTNSFIDITSDAGYAAGSTDSFSFSSSLNNLSSGGNTFFRINRNTLTHADLQNIVGVRFRLKSIGNFTFVAQALRMYRSGDFAFPVTSVDTKRDTLARSVPPGGTQASEVTGSGTPMLFASRPKNTTLVAKFNSGHSHATNPNIIQLIGRYTSDNNELIAQVSSLSGSTTLTLIQKSAGISSNLYNATVAALNSEIDYHLVLDMYENQVKMTIYNNFGVFYGTTVVTSGYQTTSVLSRGYAGFNLTPYNYDFTIDYVRAQASEFGSYISKTFSSVTPYRGATINPNASGVIDLSQQSYSLSGDATIISDSTVGQPAPSWKFTRPGSSFYGGWQSSNFLFIGNPRYLYVTGSIFPSTGNHTYRIALIDKYDSVGWMATIPNLKQGQWNDFNIPVNVNILPSAYRFVFQSLGATADTFWVQNLRLNHPTIAWQASPDNGATWYNFFDTIDQDFKGVNFSPISGTDMRSLKVRAIALSDTAWISPPYVITPIYATSGH